MLMHTVISSSRTAPFGYKLDRGHLIHNPSNLYHFQGCDASILLDSGGEKTAPPNNNSVRGYNVIDNAKTAVEKICPGVVSCADIVAVAARDASVAAGGPSWTVKLGRRDSTTGNPSQAVTDLPGFTDSLDTLISHFDKKGLSTRDMVALSGTIDISRTVLDLSSARRVRSCVELFDP